MRGNSDIRKTHKEPDTHAIFTVSQITDKIKVLLEEKFPFIWITGEISNFSSPMSGHFYFSLKDERAQISAVMFRGQNRNLKFAPVDGMAVTGLGRISVYKPRGTYQVIFEYLEPKGVGALQVAFEQLKEKLADEGLFDAENKKPIPFLPHKIALITSPTGAVIHDILRIARRRFENMQFLVLPVRVQGDGAAGEIVQAIDLVNRHGADVAIIARGGGSIEDFQAFNTEIVARAIHRSNIPVVSAVGHETDYTISDFVADMRAPTPSAAAEMIVPEKFNLLGQRDHLLKNMMSAIRTRIHREKADVAYLSGQLVDPIKRIQDLKLRCDDVTSRIIQRFSASIQRYREHVSFRITRLRRASLIQQMEILKEKTQHTEKRLKTEIRNLIDTRFQTQGMLAKALRNLSPMSVLDRGYSITRTISGKKIVTNHAQVFCGQTLEILLSRGILDVSVQKTHPGDTYEDSD